MINGIQNQVQDYDNTIQKRALDGARPLPKLQEMLDLNRDALPALLKKQDQFQKMPRIIGQVAATSGKAILGKRLVDWAFVELTDEAAESSFKPNIMFQVSAEHRPEEYNPTLGLLLPEGRPLTEFGTLKKGGYYLKLGLSTGVTGGICHGALACCNWSGKDRQCYDHNGREFELSQEITEEYVIMSKARRQSEHQQSSFAGDGDSGSFVIDMEGNVCGLFYGAVSGLYGSPGKTHYYANAGLAMALPDLTNSIKLRTVPRDNNGVPNGSPAELGLPIVRKGAEDVE